MSEKLLVDRLKSLAEEVRGPVREAMLDAAMALSEADTIAARLAEAERLLREWVADAYCDPRANLPDLVNRTRHAIGAVRSTDSAPAATELLPLHCVHGKRVYERCEQCETSATGFTRAASTAPAAHKKIAELDATHQLWRESHTQPPPEEPEFMTSDAPR